VRGARDASPHRARGAAEGAPCRSLELRYCSSSTTSLVVTFAEASPLGPSAKRSEENPAYATLREAQSRSWAESPGDPTATRGAILKVVEADEPPLRIFFGKAPIEVATADYESRLATWNEWQSVSVEAHGT
jgi:hypothetical protein